MAIIPGQKALAADVLQLIEDARYNARAAAKASRLTESAYERAAAAEAAAAQARAEAAGYIDALAAPLDDRVDYGINRAEQQGRLITGATAAANYVARGPVSSGGDDSAALQSMLDALPIGGTLLLRDGEVYDARVSIPADRTLALGRATLRPTSPSAAAVTITGSRGRVRGGTIDMTGDTLHAGVLVAAGLSDVVVDSAHTLGGGNGVRVKTGTGPWARRVSVQNCRIDGPATHGIYFNWEVVDSEIVGNFITTTSPSSNGIWAGNGSTGLRVQNNTIGPVGEMGIEIILGSHRALVQGNHVFSTGSFGISLDNSDHCEVSNNRVEDTASFNVELANASHALVTQNVLLNAGADAIRLNANSGLASDRAIISANQIVSPVGSAVAGAGSGPSSFAVVSGNSIRDCGATAVQPFAGSLAWEVTGNLIDWTEVARSSINLNGGGHTCTNNTIWHSPALAASAGTAIRVPADNCLIANNNVLGNDKVAIGVDITAGRARNTVVGNRIFGTTQDIVLNRSADTSNVINANHFFRTIGNSVTMGGASGSNFFGDAGLAMTIHSGAHRFNTNVGFYGKAPVAKPSGVAVTPEAIHAALVTLGLIAP